MRAADDDFRRVTDNLVKAAQAGASKPEIERLFVTELRPTRRRLGAAIDALTATEDRGLEAAKVASTVATEAAIAKAISITVGALARGPTRGRCPDAYPG